MMRNAIVWLSWFVAGCSVLAPDHHVKWVGVHQDKLVYETSCQNIRDCRQNATRVCGKHPWKLMFEWHSGDAHHHMVSCHEAIPLR
jgi:hypothetical protein